MAAEYTWACALALPTMEDLPSEYEGEEALPDQYHVLLGLLLMQTFRPPRYWPDRCFSAMDMYLYYQPQPVLHGLRPDWFGVVGVPRFHRGDQRTSFALWNEAAGPLIIVEALSAKTEGGDLGRGAVPVTGAPRKWDVYEQRLRVPYYVTVDHHQRPAAAQFFRHDGAALREVEAKGRRLWLPEAELGIGVWRGTFEGLTREWLRFYDADGRWIPTPEEQSRRERKAKLEALRREKQERLAKEAALEREQRERTEKERLRARLRALGLDPDAA